jgi:hypothetical protein
MSPDGSAEGGRQWVGVTTVDMASQSGPLIRLQTLETRIERGLETFIEVGEALLEIRDTKLYRDNHSTFEDYCRDRFGLRERQAYRYMDAAKAIGNLESCPIGQLPANEAQVRPLTGLKDPDLQREAWAKVVERAGEDPITARLLEEVVEEIKAGPCSLAQVATASL